MRHAPLHLRNDCWGQALIPCPIQQVHHSAAHLCGAQRLLDGQARLAHLHHEAVAEFGVGHQRVGGVVHLAGWEGGGRHEMFGRRATGEGR